MIQDFRPISLCNVIYKTITKVVANRIKSALPDIIAPNQCGFVPGRLSSDNIIVAQEVIHSMKTMKGKKGYMAIKIDLEKAYDRLRWDFILDCLQEINIPQHIIEIICQCICTPTMQVLWEGSKTEEFTPSRGIRQGDPISPYLFVLCIEKLAHFIQEEISRGHWRPIRLTKRGPLISHLFFADDMVIFAEASIDQVQVIKRCLSNFCLLSGQKVSLSKTRVCFSKNVHHTRAQQLSDLLGVTRTSDLGKYLGVPLHHNRVTNRTYQFVIDKVKQRLSNWKTQSLSFAGRNTLTKAVVATIPLYSMQTAALPMSTCTELEKNMRGFLWGSTNEKKRIHLVAWDKVCMEKRHGGLGIRHMAKQNRAFMMKAGWGLIVRKDSLWAQVVRNKYKCGNDLLPTIDKSRQGSQFWKGLKNNWEQVEKGIGKVALRNGEEAVRWNLEKHRQFTIKSTYRLLNEHGEREDLIWSRLWKLKIPQRCKTFIWLVLHDRLLTNQARYCKHLGTSPMCPWCVEKEEDTIHVLRQCNDAHFIWDRLVDPKKRSKFYSLELREWCVWNLKGKHGHHENQWSELFSVICWAIWNRRNERIFENSEPHKERVIAQATGILRSMRRVHQLLRKSNVLISFGANEDEAVNHIDVDVWVDGAFSHQTGAIGSGGILRNKDGRLLEAFMFRPDRGNSLTAELWGCILGLKRAWDHGFKLVRLQSDCAEIISLISSDNIELHSAEDLIRELRHMLARE